MPANAKLAKSLTYDFYGRAGRIFFPQGYCADMTSTIDLFQRIDARVTEILTFSGYDVEAKYIHQAGEWKAVTP